MMAPRPSYKTSADIDIAFHRQWTCFDAADGFNPVESSAELPLAGFPH
jgi:hypothetical protein